MLLDPIQKQSAEVLPTVSRFCAELLSVSQEITSRKLPLSLPDGRDDHFGLMAGVYLARQQDHMGSVLQLGMNRDAALITRSMLEGMCQILWAFQEPQARAYQWKRFAYIHDWRVLRERKAKGTSVDPEKEKTITEAVVVHGGFFLANEKDQAKPLQKLLSEERDPFVLNWTRKKVWEIFEAVEGKQLYDANYDFFSGFHHWDTGGFQDALTHEDGCFTYHSTSPREVAAAQVTAFQCLHQIAAAADSHFRLSFEPVLRKMRNEFVAAASLGQEKN